MMSRNPRRAYDKDGKEISPATIADIRALGVTTVEAVCEVCGHEAIVDVSEASDDVPVPDVTLRLRCAQCGSRNIRTSMEMDAYYHALRETTGWEPP
jgi:hypothetical protein